MNNICIIPARGGSKGVKNKNLRLVDGKPLIYYTINCALNSGIFNRIIVSSDEELILNEALSSGVEAYKRSDANSSDEIHAVYAVIETLLRIKEDISHDDVVYMLLPTAPLRLPEDLIEVDDLIKLKNNPNVVSVKKANFYYNNLRFLKADELVYLNESKDLRNLQRQDQQVLYIVNGSIFTSSVSMLIENQSFHQMNTLAYVMPDYRSVDINTEADLIKVEKILKK